MSTFVSPEWQWIFPHGSAWRNRPNWFPGPGGKLHLCEWQYHPDTWNLPRRIYRQERSQIHSSRRPGKHPPAISFPGDNQPIQITPLIGSGIRKENGYGWKLRLPNWWMILQCRESLRIPEMWPPPWYRKGRSNRSTNTTIWQLPPLRTSCKIGVTGMFIRMRRRESCWHISETSQARLSFFFEKRLLCSVGLYFSSLRFPIKIFTKG